MVSDVTGVNYFFSICTDQQYQSLDDLSRKSTKRYQHLNSVKNNNSENKDNNHDVNTTDNTRGSKQGVPSDLPSGNGSAQDHLGSSTYLVATPQASIKEPQGSRKIDIVDNSNASETVMDAGDTVNPEATRHSGVQYLDILPDIEESRL